MSDHRRHWKREIPAAVLAAGAAAGDTVQQLQARLRQAGVAVHANTIRDRLVALGIRMRRQREMQARDRLGRARPPQDVPKFTAADASRMRKNFRLLSEERAARDRLLRRAQAGNRRALDELERRYKLRLPLVEERIAQSAERRAREERAA